MSSRPLHTFLFMVLAVLRLTRHDYGACSLWAGTRPHAPHFLPAVRASWAVVGSSMLLASLQVESRPYSADTFPRKRLSPTSSKAGSSSCSIGPTFSNTAFFAAAVLSDIAPKSFSVVSLVSPFSAKHLARFCSRHLFFRFHETAF